MNHILGRYSKAILKQKFMFYDPPTTSAQELVCVRTNDTSTDTKYPNSRYTAIKNIADGIASTIYEGYDNFTENKIIIKQISKAESWRRELDVLKKLQNISSDKILKYIDFYESPRTSYIITEFYPGFDLFDHIDLNVPYTTIKGLYLINEMAKGIRECHNNNIIHLDIKCENFMVNNNKLFEKNILIGKIILIDFGHSELLKQDEDIEKLRKGKYNYGTSYYLCPEGYYNNILSSKSDIWSLAVCLSMFLSGDFPFDGRKPYYYNNSLIGNFGFKYQIENPEAELLLKSCLNINPYKRPSINKFIKKVEKILENLSSEN